MQFVLLLHVCCLVCAGLVHPGEDGFPQYDPGSAARREVNITASTSWANVQICSAWGDSYYRTFSGRELVLQGNCNYTFLQTCPGLGSGSNKSRIGPVLVQMAKANPSSAAISSLYSVLVSIAGVNVTMVRGEKHKVRVDGQKRNLPLVLGNGSLSLYPSGSSIVLETTFGLVLWYDWHHHLVVEAHPELATTLCGLCRGYSHNATDNIATIDNQAVDFALQWRVGGDEGSCKENCDGGALCPLCGTGQSKSSPGLKEVVPSMGIGCSLLQRADGPFAGCHAHLDPTPYFHSCLTDQCVFEGDSAAICRSMKAYADICQRLGGKLEYWRGMTHCPVTCPVNSHYETCASSCPDTCASPDAHLTCSSPCMETCQCNAGYLLSGGHCVPVDGCGCTHLGVYYLPKEAYWTDSQCQQQCVCPSASQTVTCALTQCQSDEVCGVLDGIQGCQKHQGPGVCTVQGDPHYTTYDGHSYIFQGTCVYQLTAYCPRWGDQPDFSVEVQNEVIADGTNASSTKTVRILVHGYVIEVCRDWDHRVMVNGLLLTLPSVLGRDKVKMYVTGLSIQVETDFGLIVTYSSDLLTLHVPRVFSGHLCGLCGNFNGDPEDDITTEEETDSLAAKRWKIRSVAGCVDVIPEVGENSLCPVQDKALYSGQDYCGRLVDSDGAFQNCHGTVDPSAYFDNCVHDLCSGAGNQTALCQVLTSYVAACQEAGAIVDEWRSPDFCNLSCPANSEYQLCSVPVLHVCVDPPSTLPVVCKEDCQCVPGYFHSTGSCVADSDCGCLYDGVYHEINTAFYPHDHCRLLCSCVRHGEVLCTNSTCPAGTECRVQDGGRSCQPVPVPGTCSVMGGRHFRTFSGRRFDLYVGSCPVVLSQVCDQENGSVLLQGDELHLRVIGVNMTLDSQQKEMIQVDGVSWNLPVVLEHMSVIQVGLTTRVTVDTGMVITYGGPDLIHISVPAAYVPHQCGLCADLANETGPGNPTANANETDPTANANETDPTANANETAPGNPTANANETAPGNPTANETSPGNPTANETAPGNPTANANETAPGNPTANETAPGNPTANETAPGNPTANETAPVNPTANANETGPGNPTDNANETDPTANANETAPGNPTANETSPGNPTANETAPGNPTANANETDPTANANETAPGNPTANETAPGNPTANETAPGNPTANETAPGNPTANETAPGNPTANETAPGNPTANETAPGNPTANETAPGNPTANETAPGNPTANETAPGNPTANANETGPGNPTDNANETDPTANANETAPGNPTANANETAPGNPTANETGPGNPTANANETGPGNPTANANETDPTANANETAPGNPTANANETAPGNPTANANETAPGNPTANETAPGNPTANETAPVNPTANANETGPGNPTANANQTAPCNPTANANQTGPGNPTANANQTAPGNPTANANQTGPGNQTIDDFPVSNCSAGCGNHCSVCNATMAADYMSVCGVLSAPSGPFRGCHATIDPQPFYDSCVSDLCLSEGDMTKYCSSLKAYTYICQEARADIQPWRGQHNCSISCPVNSHYNVCASACSESCVNMSGVASACQSMACMEGCQCNPGYVRFGEGCVRPEDCGCSHMGHYHQLGEVAWSEGCFERCNCSAPATLQCVAASCPKGATCTLVNGSSACTGKVDPIHPPKPAQCWVLAGPHYYTFDGREFDYQGNCTHTLVQNCRHSRVAKALAVSHSTVADPLAFTVDIQNDRSRELSGDHSVAIKAIHVTVPPDHIVVQRGERGSAWVNGQRRLLPVMLQSGSVKVHQSGLFAVIDTSFGLQVKYDWFHYVLVTLHQSDVCGLCGNNNGDPEDDLRTPEGTLVNATAFGWSWIIPNQDGNCTADCGGSCQLQDDGPEAGMTGSLQTYLWSQDNPLRQCHAVIRPTVYSVICTRGGTCVAKQSQKLLCEALQAYMSACQTAKVHVPGWRNSTFCPISCPVDSHYESCGSACPATCADLLAPSSCQLSCVETCQCDQGFVLEGDRCVPVSRCGCVHQGFLYHLNQTYWSDHTCTQRCVCDPLTRQSRCYAASCGHGRYCSLRDGVRQCVGSLRKMCLQTGSHFTTFDGHAFDLRGTCQYQLVGLCGGETRMDGPTPVEVHVQTDGRLGSALRVVVKVNGTVVEMNSKDAANVQVDGVQRNMPYVLGLSALIHSVGLQSYIKTDFGFNLTLGTHGYLAISLSEKYASASCGLCGNYNSDPSDELSTPGSPDSTLSLAEFARAWRSGNDSCSDGCFGDCPTCSVARSYAVSEACGVILAPNGPFRECSGQLDPLGYYRNCVTDLCHQEELRPALCNSLGQYTAVCQLAGGVVHPWRTEDFCNQTCPQGTRYALRGSHPTLMCQGSLNTTVSLAMDHGEHCLCQPGLVLSGALCVLPRDCGCFHRGEYLRAGQVLSSCQQSYECQAGGHVVSRNITCGEGEECVVREGVQGCYAPAMTSTPAPTATLPPAPTTTIPTSTLTPAPTTTIPTSTLTPAPTTTIPTSTLPPAPTTSIPTPAPAHAPAPTTSIPTSTLTPAPTTTIPTPAPAHAPAPTTTIPAQVPTSTPGQKLPISPPAAAPSLDPCHGRCGALETCMVKEGVASCGTTQGICWVWGDPHYHTFDGFDYNFEGTCTYLLAASGGAASGLPTFTISEKNDRHGNTGATTMRLVTVRAYGFILTLNREKGQVKVNGLVSSLPVNLLGSRIQVVPWEDRVLLKTDFGLQVMFDWASTLAVVLSDRYQGKVYGLCGNFNGNPLDERSAWRSGTTAAEPARTVDWASANQVPDGDPNCCSDCKRPTLTSAPAEVVASYRHKCAAIIDKNGRYAHCHVNVAPDAFYQGCVSDLRRSGGSKVVLAQAMMSYSVICQKYFLALGDDYASGKASGAVTVSCPINSHYETCGSACPSSCQSNATAPCMLLCVQSCFCDPGYVASPEGCVHPEQCGCTDTSGQYHTLNTTYYSPEDCGQLCVCDSATRQPRCTPVQCPSGQVCLQTPEGPRTCQSELLQQQAYNCSLTGGLHFTSFDGQRFDFRDGCSYTLVQTNPNLTGTGLQPFNISISNARCANRLFHSLDLTLAISGADYRISKDEPEKFLVDGLHKPLPYSSKIMISAYHTPSSIVIQTAFGLQLVLYRTGTILVLLPGSYGSAVFGLCGNANTDPADDLLMSTGEHSQNVLEFAHSWRVAEPGASMPCRAGPGCVSPRCSPEAQVLFQGRDFCGVLVNPLGPFEECSAVLSPQAYFLNCVTDTCAYGGHYSALCNSVAAYAAACQAAGLPVRQWRTDTFCTMGCPKNSHYETCASPCCEVCPGLSAPVACSTTTCQEGCQCDPGYALSDAQCVPVSECGCEHDGQYYPRGYFYPGDTCQKCHCGRGGKVFCPPSPAPCAPQEKCTVKGGIARCTAVKHGVCEVFAGFGYITFDGLVLPHHGAWTYVLSDFSSKALHHYVLLLTYDQEEDGDTGTPGMEQAARGNASDVGSGASQRTERKGAGYRISRLQFKLGGMEVSIDPRTPWKIQYNEEEFSVPFQVAEVFRVFQDGGSLLLITASGVSVHLSLPAQYLRLTVPQGYDSTTSGICGNFNGDPSDDLELRAGRLADGMAEFLRDWTVVTASGLPGSDVTPCGRVCDGQCGVSPEAVACAVVMATGSVFGACWQRVEPEVYMDMCVKAVCGGAEPMEATCLALEAYAASCRAQGVAVGPWRDNTSCTLQCPDRSSPSECVDASSSCPALLQPGGGATGHCLEGCQCFHGNVFDGDQCVPRSQCGCVHQGKYITMDGQLYMEDCAQRCWCHPLGGAVCEQAECPPELQCTLEEGLWDCRDVSSTGDY